MSKRPVKPEEKFADWLVKSRWNLLVIAIAIGGASFMLKKNISFDNSIEGMFAAGNTNLIEYQTLKDTFGGTEIVLAVYEDPDLFAADGEGLRTLSLRSRELGNVNGVVGVLSLAEINKALKRVYVGNIFSKNQIEPIIDKNDKMAAAFLKTFEGYTHSSDGKTVAIVCLLERLDTLKIPRAKTIATLRSLTRNWQNSRVTGEPVLLADGFNFIRRDGKRLNQVCLGLMAIVIICCFRSFRWVLIPVAVIQLSLWMTLSILVVVGWKLTMVSSMLSAIVAVISVATVVHITVRYREARLEKGHSREKAMELTISALVMPIMWTCLTTAAGFFALTLAHVEPISDFGWMMTIGSLSVLLSVFLLVPGLTLFGNLDADPQDTWGEGWLEKWLGYSSKIIARHPKQIGTWVAGAMCLIGCGMFYLNVETDFTKNFREDSQIIQAYTFVEERMGGAGVLDVVIQSPEMLNIQFLERVDKLQDDLRGLTLAAASGNESALTHVVSYADADRILRSNAVIAMMPTELRFRAMAEVMPGFSSQMKTKKSDDAGRHYFRIMLRTSQQKTAEQQAELIGKVKTTVDQHFPAVAGTAPTLTTGFFVLLSNLVSSVLNDQVMTFVAACIFIGIVILIAFGSPRLVLVALLPNILPIIGLLGMLGWLGIRLNMGAAMIAAVSMGLSIDGTIHYLTAYRHNKRLGHRTSTAIDRTQFRTGRAVIYSTTALVIGFGSLCISQFIPTVFFGGLVGLSMLGGMLGNLIVLPVLLTLMDGKGGKVNSDESGTEMTTHGNGASSEIQHANHESSGPHSSRSRSRVKPTRNKSVELEKSVDPEKIADPGKTAKLDDNA